jgi:hypothetical protein
MISHIRNGKGKAIPYTGSGSQISRQSAHEGDKAVSPTFISGEIFLVPISDGG